MKTKELIKLDNSLNTLSEISNILIRKRGFYIYFNEPNKKVKQIKIHTHTCGNCNWGSGKRSLSEAGRNGVWIGPFSEVGQAEKFIYDFFGANNNIKFKHTCIN